MNKYFPLAIVILTLFFPSCKKKLKLSIDQNTQQVVGAKEINSFVSPADSVVLDFEFLQAKMKTVANLNGKSQSFNTILRWQKGKKIWMSMSIFGIEGLRVLLDTGSVQWMDRINNEYVHLPMDKISSQLKIDLSFHDVESLLLGIPIWMDSTDAEFTSSEDLLKISQTSMNGYKIDAIFNTINKMLIEYQANSLSEPRNLWAKYGDIRPIENKQFAYDRWLQISQGVESIQIQAKFLDVVILDELNFPFEISSNLKKIEY